MSGEDDNFLARWSRRKRAAKAVEPPAPEGGAAPADREPPAGEEAVVAEPAEPLPRIEDLTATSDVAAFLREGVPEALKTAALRRMWSLDPAIRDHVGLAEYSWDYNAPGSMHGFGPVGSATPLDRVVSQSTMQEPAGPEESVASAPEPPAALPAGPAATPAPDAPAIPDSPSETTRLSTASADFPPAVGSGSVSSDRAGAAAEDRRRETLRGPAASRHGGALPR